MSLLLKITDGLMKGAEIVLVSGTRITMGSDETCDIVISDSTVAGKACELDIREDDVAVICPDGRADILPPFTVCTHGALSFAVGPDDVVWPELRVRETAEEKAETAVVKDVEPQEEKAESSIAITEAAEPRRNSVKWLIAIGILVAILVAAVVLLWLTKPACVQKILARMSCNGSANGETVAEQPMSLEQLAANYHLELGEHDGHPALKGNFRLTTERLAVRALALNADSHVVLDLTDDQSLQSAAEALLFVLTEGQLTVKNLANRTATITGSIGSERLLGAILKAFADDLPSVEKIDVSEVAIGGRKAPAAIRNGRKDDTGSKTVVGIQSATHSEVAGQTQANPIQNLPIAGILTSPYPCVVMQSGARYMQGAQIGNAVLEKIESDRLSFRINEQFFYWQP